MEMIRNIVFDMGNVLVIYDPVRVCRVYAQDEEEIEWIRRELFGSEEWILLDKRGGHRGRGHGACQKASS